MSGWTLVFQIVNFVVLAAVLRRFLFKPVAAMVAKRQQNLAATAAEGERVRREAEALRLNADKALAEAVEIRERALAEGRAQIAREREETLAKARQEASSTLDVARHEIDRERDKAADAAATGALDLAAVIARRLLEQVSATSLVDAFLARLCEHLDGASEESKRALRDDLGARELLVATAPPLGPDAGPRWRADIARRLGDGVAIRLVADDALVAGAELRFPHTTLSFCWRDGIKAAREELARHA